MTQKQLNQARIEQEYNAISDTKGEDKNENE